MKYPALLLLFSAIGFTQSNNTATLSGAATDATESVIPNVAMTATNVDTQLTRRTATDAAGVYRFDLLPPGNYDLKAEHPGFSPTVQRGVPLTVGAAATLDFRLQVSSGAETVEIVSEAPPIETTRTQQSNVIEQRAIADLPIDRRDYLTFSLLAPGVSDSKAHADSNTYRVKQTPDSGLSFYGSNGRGNTINVDGGESNDGGGGVRPTVGQEAVREFR